MNNFTIRLSNEELSEYDEGIDTVYLNPEIEKKIKNLIELGERVVMTFDNVDTWELFIKDGKVYDKKIK